MQNLASKILCIFVTGGAYSPYAPCLSTPLAVTKFCLCSDKTIYQSMKMFRFKDLHNIVGLQVIHQS